MRSFFDRLACVLQVLFAQNVMVMITKPGKGKQKGKDSLTLFGTIQDQQRQVYLLNRLSASIQEDIDSKTFRTQGTEPNSQA